MNSLNAPEDERSAPIHSNHHSVISVVVAILIVLSFVSGIAANLQSSNGGAQDASRIISYKGLSAYNPGSNAIDVGGGSNGDVQPMETMFEALRQVRQLYVERIEDTQEKELTYGSVAKMIEALNDPQSRFLTPDQRSLVDDAMKGKFHGIGAVLGVKKEQTENGMETRLQVIAPAPGSPAEKAGLLPGDSIREIDGKWLISYDPFAAAVEMVKGVRNRQVDPADLAKTMEAAKKKLDNGITLQKAADLLTSRDTGEFKLSVVRRKVAEPINITITPGITQVESVEHRIIEPNTGFIRINYFGESTPNQFAAALSALSEKKATSLILDVRNTPGGSTNAALKVAGMLAPGKLFAQLIRARDARELVRAPAVVKDATTTQNLPAISAALKKPIVILVNGGTSSAAEMLVAALKDAGIGVLVGSPTHGDFLQHTLFVLRDGSAVTFTTGKYLTPKGADLDQKGLPVDVPVARSDSGDPQFEKAIDVLKAKVGS